MLSKSYEQMMSEAYAFTREMGLDTSDIKPCFLPCSINEIGEEIFTEFLLRRKIPLQNLGFNCIPWSIEACRFLKHRYGIYPILTSGSLLRNDKMYLHQDKKDIVDLLRNKESNIGPARFHTWLTLGNYLLDLTLMISEWLIDEDTKNYRYQSDKYCQIIAYEYTSHNKMLFTYQPVFLGEDYFNQVKFTPIMHVIHYNTD